MKRKWLSVLICMSFLVVLFLPGAMKSILAEGDKTTVKEETGGTSAREDFSEEKKDFERKTREKLKEFDDKMADLEVKAKEAGSKAKAEVKEQMDKLREKWVALRREMEKLETKSKEKWEAAKEKVYAALDELEKTDNKARSHFK
jgi:BMFP domain-containing protein YqiC